MESAGVFFQRRQMAGASGLGTCGGPVTHVGQGCGIAPLRKTHVEAVLTGGCQGSTRMELIVQMENVLGIGSLFNAGYIYLTLISCPLHI